MLFNFQGAKRPRAAPRRDSLVIIPQCPPLCQHLFFGFWKKFLQGGFFSSSSYLYRGAGEEPGLTGPIPGPQAACPKGSAGGSKAVPLPAAAAALPEGLIPARRRGFLIGQPEGGRQRPRKSKWKHPAKAWPLSPPPQRPSRGRRRNRSAEIPGGPHSPQPHRRRR